MKFNPRINTLRDWLAYLAVGLASGLAVCIVSAAWIDQVSKVSVLSSSSWNETVDILASANNKMVALEQKKVTYYIIDYLNNIRNKMSSITTLNLDAAHYLNNVSLANRKLNMGKHAYCVHEGHEIGLTGHDCYVYRNATTSDWWVTSVMHGGDTQMGCIASCFN